MQIDNTDLLEALKHPAGPDAKSWQPVELKGENVKVENGKIVITIPVDSESGFMILQSGDASVPTGASRVSLLT